MSIYAKFPSMCVKCHKRIEVGDEQEDPTPGKWQHVDCGERHDDSPWNGHDDDIVIQPEIYRRDYWASIPKVPEIDDGVIIASWAQCPADEREWRWELHDHERCPCGACAEYRANRADPSDWD